MADPAAAPAPAPDPDASYWGAAPAAAQAPATTPAPQQDPDQAYWGGGGPPLPAPPKPGASQHDLNVYNQQVVEGNRSDLYQRPTLGGQNLLEDHLLNIGRNFGLAGQDIVDFASSGVRAAAHAIDKMRPGPSEPGNPEELRREGVSAEQYVEQHLLKPNAEARATLERPYNLGITGRVEDMATQATMMIAEAIITPGPSSLAEGGRVARMAYGATKMQTPAILHGSEVAREVYKATQDPKAALTAGVTAWSGITAMGALPASAPGSLATRTATGAGLGLGAVEAQRHAENAVMPESMHQPFDPVGDLLAAGQGAIFGGVLGGRAGRPLSEQARETHQSIMDHSVEVAMEHVKATGGDDLDAVVEGAQVNTVLGAHHDAAAFEMHHETAGREAAEREAQENAAYEQKAQQDAAQKEADFAKARNEQGQQEVDRQANLAVGNETGERGYQAPTLAEAPGGGALAALRDRLAVAREAKPATSSSEPEENPDHEFWNETPKAKAEAAATKEEEEFTPLAKQEPAARPALADKWADFMGRVGKRLAMEDQGQNILDDMEEHGRTSNQVAQKFWKDTYFKLPAEVQARFRGMLEGHSGFERKAMPDVDAGIDRMDLPDNPEHLEGTDRGFVALMDEANRRVEAQRTPLSEQEPAEGPRPPPQTLESLKARRLEAIAAAARKKMGGGPVQASVASNNASGESPASQEAVNRVAAEKEAGIRRFSIDADGGRTELRGVDAVDAKAPKGGVTVSVDKEGNRTILDRGGLPQAQANGLVNRAEGLQGPLKDTPQASLGEGVSENAPTGDQAKARLQPILDRLPPEVRNQVEIHHDASTLPRTTRDRLPLREDELGRLQGTWDQQTGKLHLIAQGHKDLEQMPVTLAHELAHMGVRKLLGKEYSDTMQEVYDNSPQARDWMKKTAEQYNLDPGNPDHQAYLADEYAAHLAEHPFEDRSAWGKIVDTVRGWAHRVGFVSRRMEWTDDDIRHMLLRSNNHLEDVHDSIRGDGLVRASLRDRGELEDRGQNYEPDHPVAQGARLGMTKELQANYSPGYIRRMGDWMADRGYNNIPKMLGTIDMRHLPDFVKRSEMPAVQQFIQMNDLKRGRQGRLQKPGFDRLEDWSKWASKNPDKNSMLGTLMNGSTLAGIDPTREYQPRWSPEETAADPTKAAAETNRQALHARLQGLHDSMLDDKGRELFQQIRDDYSGQRDATWKALEARVNETGASEETKKQTMAALRRQFEKGTVAGPYFPLARFGDHWANAKDSNGDTVAFSRFESLGEKRAWMQEMGRRGFDTDGGRKMDNKSMMERIDPDFVKKVMGVAEGNPNLQDEIWQTYLRAMPEMSMRKGFIHRQGRLGFTADVMRSYAHNMFHGSQQIARLEYGNRLDSIVGAAKDQAQGVQRSDPNTWHAEMAGAVAKELSARNDWIKNPSNSPWTSAVNQLGFNWYLGFAPATAYRIHTQNSMLASPILAAKFGQLGTWRELNKATAKWATSRGNLGDTLRGDERQAFDEAGDQGMFSNTWASTLGSAANGYAATTPLGRAYQGFSRAAQYIFNGVEHKNRQTTFLAAYRLGRQSGMDHDAAFQNANQMTWDAHLDYGNDNRARFLQNDFMKVAGQFKQYPLGVTYRLARDFRNSLGNENLSPAEVSQSRKQFAGILLRSFMYSGATGLPMMWAAEAGLNMAFGDKDKPFDARAALRSHLEQELGKTGSDAVMDGPMSAATGAALSRGASYSDLLYKTPQNWNEMGWAERGNDAMEQVLGPAWGAVNNMLGGADIANKTGSAERGIEHMIPPAAAGPLKALRYATQGVKNLRGEKIMSPEELGQGWSQALGMPPEAIRDKNLFLQSLGLTPETVSDRMQKNAVMKETNRLILSRKSDLENRYEQAVQDKDQDALASVQAEMDKFNKAHPTAQIGGKGLAVGIRNRARGEARSVHGVLLNRRLKQEIEGEYGGSDTEQ